LTIRKDNGNHTQGPIVSEVKLVGARSPGDPKDNGYQLVDTEFATQASTSMLFYVGMYGTNKEPWIQIDDITIACAPLGPAKSKSGDGGGGPRTHY
jgi:hypothetical protein